MKKEYFITIIVLIFFLFLSSEIVAQCAMCKAVAESNRKSGGSIANGLNTGILYLMAVPYIILAIIFRKQLMSISKLWKSK